ncbi:MAG TPA: pyridoxamine 5'-phosphate oxidase family protein [Chitinispirillaceae bacterium]|nr:pyridoxamine 5'-phosphate oxidase family protein [Chitinispirillaceae bacterium]
MRRKDRELCTAVEIDDVLRCGKIAQVAFIDNNQPYIVTMNYGYVNNENKIKIYFHSANEGRKIDCINNNPDVCFTIAICDPFVAGEIACNYGMKYRSVVGYGKIRIVDDMDERIAGLNLLMKQYTGKCNWEYDNEMLKRTTVTCIEVESISGKRKK